MKGFTKSEWRAAGQGKINTFFSERMRTDRKQRQCPVCSKHHGTWNCDIYQNLDVPYSWQLAKQLKLCFRCLNTAHQGNWGHRSRVCIVNGCRENHHRLLHRARSSYIRNSEQPLAVELSPVGHVECLPSPLAVISNNSSELRRVETAQLIAEGEQRNTTMRSITTNQNESEAPGFVPLRTIPAIFKIGNRRIEVNAPLDDASTKTYLNSDVAAQLGLQG